MQAFFQLRGLKFLYQNRQTSQRQNRRATASGKELHSDIQLIILSETWLKSDRSYGEFEIVGYKLVGKGCDRGNNGGVVVYVRDDRIASRRMDLEIILLKGYM